MVRLLRVLLVEDSEFDADLVLRLLHKGGYKIYHERAESAPTLRAALEKEWDLIIADYNLPQFNAPDALKMVQESGRDIPFIIVSGGIGESTAVAAMKAGAHDYLMKDNLARLVPVIDRELREAKNRQTKRQIKEALLESEMRYRLLWETATDAVLLFDEAGDISFANPAVEEIFGYKPSSLIGKKVFLLQSPDLQGDAKSGLKRYLANPEPNHKWRARETLGRRKDGSNVPIEAALSHMRMGDKLWFVVFFRDITERQKIEKELSDNQEKLRVARDIQQHLFPKSAPALAGFDIAGATLPADETGGDYFDYLPLLDDSLAVVVGDVTGHGIGPALLMAETRAYLRILARNNPEAGAMLTKANRVLAEDIGYERYVTLFLARINPITRSCTYVNAGHIPGYIIDPSGEVVGTLRRTGLPLGLRPDSTYQESEPIQLSSGQILLSVTDGFEEACNSEKEMFGTEGVLRVVHQHRHRPASEIVAALQNEVRQFTGNIAQSDDLTAIVLKVE